MSRQSKPSPDDATVELEELRESVTSLSAENMRLRDQQAVRIRREGEDRKRMESAIRRTSEQHKIAFAHLWVSMLASEHGANALRWLIQAVREMPEKPKAADLDRVRSAATSAEVVLRPHQDQRSGDAGAAFYRETQAEVTRLREFITARGRELHAASGREALGCDCAGCLLIIDMDVLGDRESAPAEVR